MMSAMLRQDDGATAVEYAIVAALIAVRVASAVALFGSNLSDLFSEPAFHEGLST